MQPPRPMLIRVRVAVVVLAALGALVVRTLEAEACSCGYPAPIVMPATGAIDVPRNVVPLVRFSGDAPVLTLRPTGGSTPIALTIETHTSPTHVHGSWLSARPAAMLDPNTEYELTAVESTETVVSTFRTGASTDAVAPEFAGISSLLPETFAWPPAAGCISSCIDARGGIVSRIHVDYAAPSADVALLVLELTASDGTRHDIALGAGTGPVELGFQTCSLQAPGLTPGETYCGRVFAYDLAGNVAGASRTECAEAASCKTEVSPDTCNPVDTCTHAPAGNGTGDSNAGCSTASSEMPWTLLAVLAGLAVAVRRQRRRIGTRSIRVD